jgi:hypothetical protein
MHPGGTVYTGGGGRKGKEPGDVEKLRGELAGKPEAIKARLEDVDRDVLFSEQFKAMLRSSGIKIVRRSIQAPKTNAFAERFVLSMKSECLDRMIFVGAASLDRAVREFMIHHHGERPHQGLENALICGGPTVSDGRVEVRDRLGGLLK